MKSGGMLKKHLVGVLPPDFYASFSLVVSV